MGPSAERTGCSIFGWNIPKMEKIKFAAFLCIMALQGCILGGPCRRSPEKLKSELKECEQNYAELQDLCPEDIPEDSDAQIAWEEQ